MRYSFKRARSKALLQKDTKFWSAFLISSTTILIGLNIALDMKISSLEETTIKTKVDRERLSGETDQKKNELAQLKEHQAYVANIDMSNNGIRDSVKNLFDIVPDKITLNKIELTPNCLALFGTTPSRDIFNLQFAPALKSIFTKSETSFVRTSNGNSRFISINRVDKAVEGETKEAPKPQAKPTEDANKTHGTPKHEEKKAEKTDKGHH